MERTEFNQFCFPVVGYCTVLPVQDPGLGVEQSNENLSLSVLLS